jgi:hypothetical protein
MARYVTVECGGDIQSLITLAFLAQLTMRIRTHGTHGRWHTVGF